MPPTNLELRVSQKAVLHDLLELERRNIKAGVKVLGLNRLINKSITVMEQEDVALVKQMIEQLNDEEE